MQGLARGMSLRREGGSIALNLVLAAAMGGLYIVFRLVPTFPMFGIPGASFRAGDFVAPFYGILLGPVLGPLSIVIGTVTGFAWSPPVFLGLDFLPGAVCAATVGLAARQRWKEAAMMNAILIIIFLLLPFTAIFIQVGSYTIPYVWLHVVGFALLISPLSRWAARTLRSDWTNSIIANSRYLERQFLAVLVLAFAGTLAQHIMGGILTQFVVGINFQSLPGRSGQYQSWQGFWTFIFWIYPIERTIIALVAAVVASPSIVALKVSGLTRRLSRL